MSYRIAYHLPDVAPRVAKESPAFRRLRQQCSEGINGKWTCFDHPDGGTMAVWPTAGALYSLDDFGEPRATTDGMTFYPSKDEPELTELLKGELSRPSDGEWVTLANGAEVFIAIASLSERRWILSANGATRAAPLKNQYGILARQLYQLVTAKDASDFDEQSKLEIQLVIAAFHASYDVTDELIEDLSSLHLSDVDIAMIRGVAWGLSPKESAAVLTASRSSATAAESIESHLLHLSPSL